jgi:hypothetical protein
MVSSELSGNPLLQGRLSLNLLHLEGSPGKPFTSFLSNSSYDTALHSTGLGYHGRRASVPSSPTQPVQSRHRRLSEPFNSSLASHSVLGSLDSQFTGDSEATTGMTNDNGHKKVKDHPKPILFKTELCRSWEEKGSCRYGYRLMDQAH